MKRSTFETEADNTRIPPKYLRWAAIAYVLFITYGCLVPFNLRSIGLSDAVREFSGLKIQSLAESGRTDAGVNFLLLMPFSFLWFGAIDTARREKFRIFSFFEAVLTSSLLAVAFEFVQIWFPPRVSSWNDIFNQIAGATLAAVAWWWLGATFSRWWQGHVRGLRQNEQVDWWLQAYAIGFVLYNVMPLDLSVHLGELALKYRDGKIQLVPFRGNYAGLADVVQQFAMDIVTFIPIGALMARLTGSATRTSSIIWPFILTVLAATLLEVAQIVVISRYVDTTDILLAAIGGTFGIVAARRWLRSPDFSTGVRAELVQPSAWKWTSLIAMIVYGALLVVGLWYPYDFSANGQSNSERIGRLLSIPFVSLFWSSEFNALNHMLLWFLLYLPLGAFASLCLLGWSPAVGRPLACWIGALVSLVTASAVECGQLFLPSHIVDNTQVIISMLGGLVGSRMAYQLLKARDEPASRSLKLRPSILLHRTQRVAQPNKPSSLSPLVILVVSLLVSAGLALGAFHLSESVGPDAAARNHPEPNDPLDASQNVLNSGSSDPVQTAGKGKSNAGSPSQLSLPWSKPSITEIPIPHTDGMRSIWGALGKDAEGRIWFAVSSDGRPKATSWLFRYDPAHDTVTAVGDTMSQLARLGLNRVNESQMKIHSRIQLAQDGYLYFASMDEAGENSDGSRLPDWGSHIWRLHPSRTDWEHLASVPEALIASSGTGRFVYFLGYFGHVLYQLDTLNGRTRRVQVGSVGGHISRNFVSDANGHVYCPRVSKMSVGPAGSKQEQLTCDLIEFDDELQEIGSTRLEHYGATADEMSHGITGLTDRLDGSILITTHLGCLYQILPRQRARAHVKELGWMHPAGTTYAPSLFSFPAQSFVAGIANQGQRPFEWVVFDLENRRTAAFPFELAGDRFRELPLLYGSNVQDANGRFYVVGQADYRPVLVRVEPTGNPLELTRIVAATRGYAPAPNAPAPNAPTPNAPTPVRTENQVVEAPKAEKANTQVTQPKTSPGDKPGDNRTSVEPRPTVETANPQSTDDLRRLVLSMKGADWLRLPDQKRQEVCRLIARWLNPTEDATGIEFQSQQLRRRLDAIAPDPSYNGQPISTWIPLIYGVITGDSGNR